MPKKPTGAIITGKLKKAGTTLVYVHGPGYAAGYVVHLRGKNSKQCWQEAVAATCVPDLWSANVYFVACPKPAPAGKPWGGGTDEIAVTVTNPADPTDPESGEIAVPGVEVP